MNKLSKAQADWLINAIKNNKSCTGYTPELGFFIVAEALEKLINQCTEKEFPKFKLKSEDGDILIMLDASIFDDKFNAVSFLFSNKHESAVHGLLYPEEFQSFTDGCIEICRWLDEQS